MDGAELILNTPVMPPSPLEQMAGGLRGVTSSAETKKTQQVAKDFESVLLTKVFDEMKNTIGKWTEEEDVASDQVKGLFWLFLARDVADKGGMGLWKDLSRFFTDLQKPNTPAQTLDESL